MLAVLAAGVFSSAYQAGQNRPREQTRLAVDEAKESAFLSLFQKAGRPDTYEQFPAFDYIDAQGRQRRFHVGREEFVLLNVWATWCPPCLIELPELEKLRARLPEDGAVRVMAVSVDQGATQDGLKDFLAKRGLWQDAAQLDTQGVIMRNAPIQGLPTSFLLGEGGEILYIFEGAAPWAGPAAQAFFDHLPAVR